MKARITVDRNFVIGKTDKRLYGTFLEHMGRAIYGGIYQPSHPSADEDGFRQDVMDLVKKTESSHRSVSRRKFSFQL